MIIFILKYFVVNRSIWKKVVRLLYGMRILWINYVFYGSFILKCVYRFGEIENRNWSLSLILGILL